MRVFLSAILIISLSSSLADQPYELGSRHIPGTGPTGIDNLVYSQTYNFENLLNGYSIYGAGDRWACDDVEVIGLAWIHEIYVWMIWTGGHASTMNLVVSKDDTGDSDPNTNTDVWAESASCTNTFTGDSSWGFDIYENHIILYEDSYTLELLPGIHYYFETQADISDNCFILVSHNYIGDYCWYNDGSGIWERSDVVFEQDSDMFFDFDGQFAAVESETWGNIKILF
ncbi:MAG: hypothetical protein K8R76_11335 [Candidatus Aegiribacteria sp.]|nr:hypothetical protein [Candidatus Aegiribacteria sp.]